LRLQSLLTPFSTSSSFSVSKDTLYLVTYCCAPSVKPAFSQLWWEDATSDFMSWWCYFITVKERDAFQYPLPGSGLPLQRLLQRNTGEHNGVGVGGASRDGGKGIQVYYKRQASHYLP